MSETRMYAFIEGRGEGCDHTIGCNQLLVRLDANTTDEAVGEALEKAAPDGWSEYQDERIAKITILRVTEKIDCAPKIAELRAKQEATKRATERDAKRAEIQRLRRELGEA